MAALQQQQPQGSMASSLSVKDKSKRRASAFVLNPNSHQHEFVDDVTTSHDASINNVGNYNNYNNYNNQYYDAGHESGYGDWNNGAQHYHQQPQQYEDQQAYRFTNYQQQLDQGIQIGKC